jgi:hypothetical protein
MLLCFFSILTRLHRSRTLQTAQTADHPTHITMFISLFTLLRVLVASATSIPFAAAQTLITTDQVYATLSSTAAPAPGFNAEGGSVFGNFVNAFNNKQFFLIMSGSYFYEKPGSEPVSGSTFGWCSDLTFSDFSNSSLIGYAARCVYTSLAGYAEALAAGAQHSYSYSEGEFSITEGVSAVFTEQLNIFQGQLHPNNDDNVFRFWDDGRKSMPSIAWEGHDEGDIHPNAATASWSLFSEITWMTVEEVAQLFNTSTDEFTPNSFKQVYLNTWIKSHEKEAAENNPNAEAELEIIEEVKNEADSANGTTSPAAPNTEDGGTVADPATPVDDGSAGNGRKLASVAARFVSASLRVFGI